MSKYPGRVISNLAPAGYSVFFDGTGDYLSCGSQSAYALGTGNFTVEAWVYVTSRAAEYNIASTRASAGTVNGWSFAVATGGGIAVYTDAFVFNNVGTVPLNTWTHVAFVREGTGTNQTKLYINGTSVASATNSQNFSNTTLAIGAANDGSQFPFLGNISNFRMVKGTALYTSNFTVPTQLFNVPNTSLLTCNSPALVDQSSNNFTITANGNAAVSTLTPFTAYVPYNPALGASTPGVWTLDEALQAAATRQWNMYDPNFQNTTLLLHGNSPTNVPTLITDSSGNNLLITPVGDVRAANLSPFSLTTNPTSGSAYFDGSGDQLTLANNAVFDPGSGNFTIECWVYLTGTAGSVINYSNGQTSNSNFAWEIYQNSTTSIQATMVQGSNAYIAVGTFAVNTWTHLAGVRNGNSWNIYVNGVAGSSPQNVTGVTVSSPGGSTVKISGYNNAAGMITGYVSNVRFVKGVAVYTGNFTTPTAPLTATQAAGTNISAITGTQTSLLTLQNSQSANNNAFLDSSSNNFLITRNGNTTQGSFSPFSQTGWSNFFTAASSQFISLPNNAAFQFGAPSGNTNDFVVEFFVYPTTTAISAPVHTGYTSGTTYWGFNLNRTTGGVNTAGHVQFFLTDNFNVTATTGLISNQQNHICAVRTGTTVSLFVNGVRQATGTSSVNPNPTGLLYVGGEALSLGRYLDGYVSNLRIIKGATLPYDANALSITVPTSQLTAITGTTVLTCQSNRFVDNSTNNFTISTSGTPSVQAFSPFYPTAAYTPQTIGGSGFFDGAADNLTVAGNAAFAFGTGDFTLEAWINPTTISTGTFDRVCATSDFNGSGFDWAMNTGSSSLFLASSSYGFAINTRSWSHIVYARSGTTLRGFLNGRLASYNTGVSQNISSTTSLLIGQGYSGTNLNGYMADLRIIKGSIPTSYQTSATTVGTQVFTPPTAPLTTTSQGATSGNVSLLLNYTNAGVVDSTGKNVLETVGNAQISTAVSRFGGSSMFFDGATDYLSSTSINNVLGGGDFTIEFWVNGTYSGVKVLVDWAGAPQLYMNGTSLIWFWTSNRITETLTSNTWQHVAIVRASGVTRMYINGVANATTWADTTVQTNQTLTIGGRASDPNNTLNGYIDELRITRFARYTGNFTPQTSQWQDQ